MSEDAYITPEDIQEAKKLALSVPLFKKFINFYELSYEDELQQMFINITSRLKVVNAAIKRGELSKEGTGDEIEALIELIIKFPKIQAGMISLKNLSQGKENSMDIPETELQKHQRLGLT